MGCTSPFWLTEPVTAMSWRSGTDARLERSAYTSVDDALSPSMKE